MSLLTDVKDMKPGTVMYYNWNRMCVLGHMPQTDEVREENSMRVAFQNAYSGPPGEDLSPERLRVVEIIKKTLTPDVISTVDKLMKSVKSR